MHTPSSSFDNKSFENIWKRELDHGDIKKLIEVHEVIYITFRRIISETVTNLLDNNSTAIKVLEVGCGSGVDTALIASTIDQNTTFIASDISLKSANIVWRVINHLGIKNVTPYVADGFRLPFMENSFDLIYSQGVLEHFRDPSAFLREQKRILRKDGYIIVCVPQMYNMYSLTKAILIAKNRWPYGWETQYSIRGIRKLARQEGLEVVSFCGMGAHDFRYLTYRLKRYTSRQNLWILKAFVEGYSIIWKRFERSILARIERNFGAYFMRDLIVVLRHA